MTIPEAKQKLVNWCNSQVGYHESWDGSNKYGADGDWTKKLYGFDGSNVPWCFTEGTLVLTDEGYKCIEDLEIGDSVLNSSGAFFNHVTQISVHDAEVVDYRVYGVIPFSVTPDHPFLSQVRIDKWHRKHGFKEWGYHKIGDLNKGDVVAVPRSPVLYEDFLSYDDLWTTGYFVGNGHCSRGREYVISSNKDKAPFVEKHAEGHWDKDYKSRTCPQFNLHLSNNPLLRSVLDDCGHLAPNKRVPRCILFGTNEAKKAFLDGYFAADGCEVTNSFNSVSELLVTGVAKLLYDLGYGCSIVPQKRASQGQIWDQRYNAYRTFNQKEVIYNCTISTTDDETHRHYVPGDNYTFLPLREIGESRTDTVYTITTDGDHSYTANNIGVHNCDLMCDYAFIHTFGYETGTKMTFQHPSGYALCRASADAYKQHGHWYDRLHPELCDQVFFYDGSGEINHTGIVVGVNGDQITCVEGNYGDAVGRTYYNYKISNQIAGYGRPDWSLVEQISDSNYPENIPTVEESTIDPGLTLSDDRHYIHLQNGDGINHPIPEVKAWQNLLLSWGYNLGIAGADGEFGSMTTNATIQFQQRVGLIPDGVVDQEEWEQAIYVG